jgi:hypothetical protein
VDLVEEVCLKEVSGGRSSAQEVKALQDRAPRRSESFGDPPRPRTLRRDNISVNFLRRDRGTRKYLNLFYYFKVLNQFKIFYS